MKLERARLVPFRLPMARPLVTTGATLHARDGVLLVLESQDGTRGFGECTPMPGFGDDDPAAIETALEEATRLVIGADANDPAAALLRTGTRTLPAAARAALDGALHDLAARRRGLPLARCLADRLRTHARRRVEVNQLLAADAPEALAREARAAWAAGFETLKLKVGVRPLEDEVGRIAAVRAAIGDRAKLRLDANGAWSEAAAERALERFAALGIEFLEQPVAADALPALARLRARAPFPIAADESAATPDRARLTIGAKAADLLVVKPSVAGGPSAALEIVGLAREAGLGVVVTSALDGAVGVATALHVAAAASDRRLACGLATSAWLADDLTRFPAPRRGRLGVPGAPGLGFDPDERALARLTRGPERRIPR